VRVVIPWNIEPPSWVKEDPRIRDVINAPWDAISPILVTESGAGSCDKRIRKCWCQLPSINEVREDTENA